MPAQSKLMPPIQNISWNRIGSPPSLSNILITIIELQEVSYVQYYFQFENTSVQWLTAPGLSSSYLEHTQSHAELPLALQNLDSLYAGTYKATIYIEFSNINGYFRTLTSVVNLTLTGNPPDAISTDKTNYAIIYNRSTNSLSGDTAVTILNNSIPDNLLFESIGSTLLKEDTVTTSVNLQEDPAFPFSTNAELPEFGIATVNCRLKKDGNTVCNFTVTIAVIGENEIIADPEAMSFLLRKGYNETQSRILHVINPLNKSFTITGPDWLNFSAASGSASAEITVTTDNSETVDIGTYSGNILIFYDSKTISVPVTLEVIGFVTINTADHNFCLDDIFLTASKMEETGRFVRVRMQVLIAHAGGSFFLTSEYQIPYFQDKVKTDIGRKIQNQFPIFQDHLLLEDGNSFENQRIYKPAVVNLTVEEIDVNYNILHSETISNLEFFAGHRPKLFPLFTDFEIRRKYSGSGHIFSYFTGETSPEDFTGTSTPSNPATNNEVQAVLLTGPVIDFNVLRANLDLQFLPFPDTQDQFILQWLNHNLVPEWFIFSGIYKYNSEYEHTNDNFMLHGRKYDTKVFGKITINTGFILKEESETIESIIKSPLCWLRIKSKIYKCFSVSQKLVKEDSDLNLVQYDIEFFHVL